MRLTMFLGPSENTPLEALWFEERKDDLWWMQAGMGLCPVVQQGRRKNQQESVRGGIENSAHQAVLLASARRGASSIQASRSWFWLPGLIQVCSSARLWVQGQEFLTLSAGRRYGRHISMT